MGLNSFQTVDKRQVIKDKLILFLFHSFIKIQNISLNQHVIHNKFSV